MVGKWHVVPQCLQTTWRGNKSRISYKIIRNSACMLWFETSGERWIKSVNQSVSQSSVRFYTIVHLAMIQDVLVNTLWYKGKNMENLFYLHVVFKGWDKPLWMWRDGVGKKFSKRRRHNRYIYIYFFIVNSNAHSTGEYSTNGVSPFLRNYHTSLISIKHTSKQAWTDSFINIVVGQFFFNSCKETRGQETK